MCSTKCASPVLPGRLVDRADRVIQVADHDGGVRARQDQGLEAIGQGPLEDRQVPDPGRRGAGGQSSGHGCPFLELCDIDGDRDPAQDPKTPGCDGHATVAWDRQSGRSLGEVRPSDHKSQPYPTLMVVNRPSIAR